MTLTPALPGQRSELVSDQARLSYYRDGPDQPDGQGSNRPLLLIHSINAAGSGYEVGPLYRHYRHRRPVYALDLPGFGFSERRDRVYTPPLMTGAIHAMVAEIRRRHGHLPIDALALSLSSEFLARAAVDRPEDFRSIALVSPTGFDRNAPYDGPPGSTRAMPRLRRFLTFPLWSRGLYRLLTSRASIRFFLKKTWGSSDIDPGMVEYDYLTAHQPGARHAPYSFVAGFLFSKDISRVYGALDLPVWMVHGVRGDFVDYRYKTAFEDRPDWQFQVFPTGALPHSEVPEDFIAGYEDFLGRLEDAGLRGTPAPTDGPGP